MNRFIIAFLICAFALGLLYGLNGGWVATHNGVVTAVSPDGYSGIVDFNGGARKMISVGVIPYSYGQRVHMGDRVIVKRDLLGHSEFTIY